jgi:integrase
MVHIRGLIHQLWKFAMWERDVLTQMNPMELVTVKGATKCLRKPHNLTEEEFRKFIVRLEEPVRTIALMCVSFGLRISGTCPQVERCGLTQRDASGTARNCPSTCRVC